MLVKGATGVEYHHLASIYQSSIRRHISDPYIEPIILKWFQWALKNKFQANQVETFCKIYEKLALDLILALFGFKKGPKTVGVVWTQIKRYC